MTVTILVGCLLPKINSLLFAYPIDARAPWANGSYKTEKHVNVYYNDPNPLVSGPAFTFHSDLPMPKSWHRE